MLGIPPLTDGTGASVAGAVIAEINKVGGEAAMEAIICLSYDTTSVNSGKDRGAVARIERIC